MDVDWMLQWELDHPGIGSSNSDRETDFAAEQ